MQPRRWSAVETVFVGDGRVVRTAADGGICFTDCPKIARVLQPLSQQTQRPRAGRHKDFSLIVKSRLLVNNQYVYSTAVK